MSEEEIRVLVIQSHQNAAFLSSTRTAPRSFRFTVSFSGYRRGKSSAVVVFRWGKSRARMRPFVFICFSKEKRDGKHGKCVKNAKRWRWIGAEVALPGALPTVASQVSVFFFWKNNYWRIDSWVDVLDNLIKAVGPLRLIVGEIGHVKGGSSVSLTATIIFSTWMSFSCLDFL